MQFDTRTRYTFRTLNILQEKRKKCFEGHTAFKTILKKLSASKLKKKLSYYVKKIKSLKYIKNEGNYIDIFIK